MKRNPILDIPLCEVIRPEIALPLQHMLQLYTVGSFLRAWNNPRNQHRIEQVFETPYQARHAVQVCAAWLGIRSAPAQATVPSWWMPDEKPPLHA